MKWYKTYKKQWKVLEFQEVNKTQHIIIDLEWWAVVDDEWLYLIPIDKNHINRTSLGNAIYFLNKKWYDFLSEAIYWRWKKDVYFKLIKND